MLGLLGVGGAGLAAAPELRVLTWPLLALNAWTLGRGWYLQVSHNAVTLWQRRPRRILVASTGISIALWTLRLLGLLGPKPFLICH